MKRYELATRGRRVAILAFLAVAALAVPGLALPGSDFESADGNLVVDRTRDWESLKGQVAIGQDMPTGTTDDSLGDGAKEDSSNPTVHRGSVPNNKSDLDRFYVASEGTFPGKDFLYLGWTRNNTLGTANMSIELNRLPQPAPPATGPWALNRSEGDALILYDFARSGRADRVELRLSRWVTSGDPLQVCEARDTVPCWGKVTVLGSDVAEGAINLAPTTDPLNGGKALPEGTFGEAAINLTDTGLTDLCEGFSSAMIRSRSSASFNAALKDFIAPIKVSIFRSPDPTGAHADGSATGAKVDSVTALGASNPKILPDPPGAPIATSQTGPGSATDGASQENVRVPEDGSRLTADVVRATSTSAVAATGAGQTSTAEAVNVNVMNGVVRAEFVRGVAITKADARSSGFSSAGSTIKGLIVNGQRQNDVAPNTRIGLPAELYGEGSFVALFELGPDPVRDTGTTSRPPVGGGGAYAADLEVTMIRVHVTDDNGLLPGGNPAEVIVSGTAAHSDFPGIRCTDQEVAGHAFVASETTQPPLVPTRVGYVAISPSGGEQRQHLDSVTLGGGSVLTAGAADSLSSGTLTDTSSEANSFAEVQDVCALKDPVGECTVSATLLKAASQSQADGSSRSSDAADTTVVAGVQGEPVLAQEPNTTRELDGLGFVTFNEQICDAGASLEEGCAQGSRTGLTVRGIHIVVTIPDNPLGLEAGSEVIVTEAHSGASFVQ